MDKDSFIEITNLNPKESIITRSDFEPNKVNFNHIKEENRKDWFDKVTHFIAGVVILFFLFLLTFTLVIDKSSSIPDYFISIVSTIIGFYFARYLHK